ncbi:MAG TPA: HAMP domain-containing protein [Bacteroidota bacterium]|nr:HAMP domain-containing protein [Bacteroidota bacterium]
MSFVLIGLFTIVLTGWQAFENARNAIESLTFDRLTSIRETKKRQIESYVQQVRNQVIMLADDRTITEGVETLTAAYRTNRSHQSQNDILPAPGQSGNHPEADNSYRMKLSALDSILQNYLRRFGYEDILLADASEGDIIYSVRRKADFATNLVTGAYSQTNLASIFHEVVNSHDREFARLVDFSPYPPSSFAPAAFVLSPIYNVKKIVGVIIIQLSSTAINRVMTSDNNWRDEGLGETGETYIVGSDFRLRTDSRFFIQEPDAYFQRLLRIGTDSAVVREIRRQHTSILLQSVRTEGTLNAMKGSTDTRIISDYRGIPVVSSYTPLKIADVHWVMLAEIDVHEAFGSAFALRERLILLGFVILFLAAVAGVFISRTISRPILSLAGVAKEFGRGDLAHRSDLIGNDEIGRLASAFNSMAEKIEQKTEQLEAEIAERTRAEGEVLTSQERLRNLSAHLQTVREEERKGISREIHDELGQALTTLKLNLTLLQSEIEPENAIAHNQIKLMLQLVDTTIKSVKRLITSLRPLLLDDLGLTVAIEWQIDEFQERTAIPCEISIAPDTIIVDPERSIAVFRILQETLTNIARHSGASSSSVFLGAKNGELELCVRDNGKGITVEELNDPKSFGLIGIRERAYYWGGRVDIAGSPGEGTTVTVHIPLQKEKFYD